MNTKYVLSADNRPYKPNKQNQTHKPLSMPFTVTVFMFDWRSMIIQTGRSNSRRDEEFLDQLI